MLGTWGTYREDELPGQEESSAVGWSPGTEDRHGGRAREAKVAAMASGVCQPSLVGGLEWSQSLV